MIIPVVHLLRARRIGPSIGYAQWDTFKVERRWQVAPDLFTPPVSASTHYARITTDRIVSALSAHRAVPLRLTRLAECGATFPPFRVPLQQRRQKQHQRLHLHDVAHSQTP